MAAADLAPRRFGARTEQESERTVMDVTLVMFKEDGKPRQLPLKRGVSTVGRKADCTIRIPLPSVSRRHAVIEIDDSGAAIKDLGASNGTYLNSRRIKEEELEAGDQISVGPVVFTVQIDGSPPLDHILPVKSKATVGGGSSSATVGTSKHVYVAGDEVDPIAALEALASSADQTAIHDEEDEFTS